MQQHAWKTPLEVPHRRKVMWSTTDPRVAILSLSSSTVIHQLEEMLVASSCMHYSVINSTFTFSFFWEVFQIRERKDSSKWTTSLTYEKTSSTLCSSPRSKSQGLTQYLPLRFACEQSKFWLHRLLRGKTHEALSTTVTRSATFRQAKILYNNLLTRLGSMQRTAVQNSGLNGSLKIQSVKTYILLF